MPDSPQPYTYWLTLDDLNARVACFRYVQAPAPTDDDTRLELNRPSWEDMDRPSHITITIAPGSV